MNARRIAAFCLIGILALASSACTNSAAPTPPPTTPATSAPAASPTSAEPQLQIYYDENCQVELVGASGRRIYIDVWNADTLNKQPSGSDIVLTTHKHGDHYAQPFVDGFAGSKVTAQNGDFDFDGVRVRSIPASHSNQPIDSADPDNHIFVIDFEGFHIVHFGSTGQEALTAEQLAAIGKPDIAFALLIDLNLGNNTSPTKVIEQSGAKLVVPTHTALASVQNAGAAFKGFYTNDASVTIKKSDLPAQTTLLFMGQLATTYGAILKIPQASW